MLLLVDPIISRASSAHSEVVGFFRPPRFLVYIKFHVEGNEGIRFSIGLELRCHRRMGAAFDSATHGGGEWAAKEARQLRESLLHNASDESLARQLKELQEGFEGPMRPERRPATGKRSYRDYPAGPNALAEDL